METEDLKSIVKDIVEKATILKNKHTECKDAPVNYACFFSHSDEEFASLVGLADKMGSVVKETPTGPIFLIETISTVAGNLKILKIRKPFTDKPQMGYADFTLSDYPSFKKTYLSDDRFELTVRENYEMIGIKDSEFDVFAYFAYPPLDEQLSIK